VETKKDGSSLRLPMEGRFAKAISYDAPSGRCSVTFHSLRHRADSLLIGAGADPPATAGSLRGDDARMVFSGTATLSTTTRNAPLLHFCCTEPESVAKTLVK
jgi:hypothetical protein